MRKLVINCPWIREQYLQGIRRNYSRKVYFFKDSPTQWSYAIPQTKTSVTSRHCISCRKRVSLSLALSQKAEYDSIWLWTPLRTIRALGSTWKQQCVFVQIQKPSLSSQYKKLVYKRVLQYSKSLRLQTDW